LKNPVRKQYEYNPYHKWDSVIDSERYEDGNDKSDNPYGVDDFSLHGSPLTVKLLFDGG
jgi:hypothetical protein